MSRQRVDPWYVTGFLEGTGCFTFSRSGSTLALYFALKTTAADREALEEVREFFGGAGRIYELSRARSGSEEARSSREVLYYRVTRLFDLRAIVEHLRRYPLRGSKSQAFAVWREMFEIKCAQIRRPSSLRLDELARLLSTKARGADSRPTRSARKATRQSDPYPEAPVVP